MMATELSDFCYQNEGYRVEADIVHSSSPQNSPPDVVPCPVVVISACDNTGTVEPATQPPSSPTFSCKTQISIISLDVPQCRICQDTKAKEKLVSPCGCLGSSKFVHKKCLLKWIMLKGADRCEICQKLYDKRITKDSCFTPSEENTIASSIVVLLLLFGVTSVGVYLMVDHFDYHMDGAGISVWVPIILLGLGMIGLSLFIPWFALFCVRTNRMQGANSPLTRFATPIALNI